MGVFSACRDSVFLHFSNALHAVSRLPKEKRIVTLMLREADGRMLFSVKNPIEKVPEFVDGIPVSKRKGHGYGTQSIRYLTEKLGGNCQFTVKDSMFITRVIL
jgi:sensor histidine kinase regulating citrate/malate metabolism